MFLNEVLVKFGHFSIHSTNPYQMPWDEVANQEINTCCTFLDIFHRSNCDNFRRKGLIKKNMSIKDEINRVIIQ